ncbi:MAG: class I SAM-dependent methyltransferase [bacterium]
MGLIKCAKDFLGLRACPHQFSFILVHPLRKLWLSPTRLSDRLHLSKSSLVLEIGPGPGFFSVEVAQCIPEGHLALFDIQKEMLKKVRRKLVKAELENVSFVQGDACGLPYEASVFDVAFLITVLGEVPDAPVCLREIHRVLRTGGLLSISEQCPDPDFISINLVRQLTENEGFTFIENYGRRWNFTANFRKL